MTAPRTILVVDDELAVTASIAELLEWEGHHVLTAGNGREALDVLAREPVDVVLLDVMMPVLDGRRTMAAMRADARLRAIPVVLMSAAAIPRDLQGVVVATLRKPFGLAELFAALERAFAVAPREA